MTRFQHFARLGLTMIFLVLSALAEGEATEFFTSWKPVGPDLFAASEPEVCFTVIDCERLLCSSLH